MRKSFSRLATDLLTSLLEKDPSLRLGYGDQDAEDIMNHEFFDSLDWTKLENKQEEYEFGYFKPKVKSKTDLKYIDQMFTDEEVKDTPVDSSKLTINEKRNNYFDEFTYTKDNNFHHSDEDSISSDKLLDIPEEDDFNGAHSDMDAENEM